MKYSCILSVFLLLWSLRTVISSPETPYSLLQMHLRRRSKFRLVMDYYVNIYNAGIKRRRREGKEFRNRESKRRPDYSKSPWAIMLQNPNIKDPDSSEGRHFRRRFRIPYPIYEILLELVRSRKWYSEGPKCGKYFNTFVNARQVGQVPLLTQIILQRKRRLPHSSL